MIEGCTLQTEQLIPCKIDIAIYKAIAGTNDPYSQKKLKEVYEKLGGVKVGYVNYMIAGGCLYIVPSSGQGLEEDCRIMSTILQH